MHKESSSELDMGELCDLIKCIDYTEEALDYYDDLQLVREGGIDDHTNTVAVLTGKVLRRAKIYLTDLQARLEICQ